MTSPSVSATYGVASQLLAELTARGWSLAVAESLTGGLLTSAIVEIPGASASLRGGVVAYDTRLKQTVLGVSRQLLDDGGPVQPEVAAQMARGVRAALAVDSVDADVGIATTGIAGPVSPDRKPVGTVDLAVAVPGRTRTERHVFRGDRDAIRAQAVARALELALETIRGCVTDR